MADTAEDEYRISFTIERRRSDELDFSEIGFGSSGAWTSVDQAAHIVDSMVQTRGWETENGQPDPKEVDHG